MSAQVCQLTGPGVTEVQIHCTIDVTSFFTKLLSMVSSPNPSLPHRIIFVKPTGGTNAGWGPPRHRHIQKPFKTNPPN